MSQMLPRSRWSKLGEVALWSSACTVVLAAHLAAAAVMLREEPVESADAAQPAAIMIELAPEPEAAETEETLVSEETQDSQEVKSETTEPVKEPPPEPVTEPAPEPPPQPPEEVAETKEPPPPEPVIEEPKPEEPVEETTQAIPEKPPEPIEEPVDETAEQQLALLQNLEVPLPVVRPPEVEEPKPETVQEKPKPVEKKVVRAQKPKPQSPAAKAAQQAKAEVQQSNRTAAAATSTSLGGNSISPARWQAKLYAHLSRQRGGRCPAAGRGNTVYVSFRIDEVGNISAVSLAKSSGHADFDSYMVDLVRRAPPGPPPPPGISNKVLVPLISKNC